VTDQKLSRETCVRR